MEEHTKRGVVDLLGRLRHRVFLAAGIRLSSEEVEVEELLI